MTLDFATLYPAAFIGGAITLAAAERLPALRRTAAPTARRWTSNLGLFALGTVLASAVLPAGVVAYAAALSPGWLAQWPVAAQVVATFLLLDLWRYGEHRLLHRVPLLWRLHVVHHSDTHLDVTTSQRHHPLEALLGLLLLLLPVTVFHLPATGVGVYLVVAALVELAAHGNLAVARRFGRALGRVVVTPALHAVHHSDRQAETDSNYGAVLAVWDQMFGTYTRPDQARIPHFGLQYFHLPRDTGAWGVLRQPFVVGRCVDYPPRQPDAPQPHVAAAPALTHAERAALAGAAAGVALVVAAMGSALVGMAGTWRHTEPYQYAWLVLPVTLVAFALQWRTLRATLTPEPSGAGVVVVAGAAVVFCVGTLMKVDVVREVAFVAALQGVVLAALGTRACKALLPALLLPLFMVPSGDLLQPVLLALTREAAAGSARLAGWPCSVDGAYVTVAGHRYVVADACSGLSGVLLGGFVGHAFGLLLRRPLRGVLALAALGAALGVVANVLRVSAIVLWDAWRGAQMPLAAHGAAQWITMLAVAAGLIAIVARSRIANPAIAVDGGTPWRRRRTARAAPFAAGLAALVIAGGGSAWSAAHAPAPAVALPLPAAIGSWTAVADASAAPAPVNALRGTYRRDDAEARVVVLAEAADAKLQAASLAPVDGGPWRAKDVRREETCDEGACFAYLHAVWRREHGSAERHAYYAYDVDGALMASRLAARAKAAWQRLAGDGVPLELVGVTSAAPLAAADVGALLRGISAPGAPPRRRAG